MSKTETLRGRQIFVGKLSFVLPADVPVTDVEVVEREKLIARIEAAVNPYRAVAKFGDDVVKMLREDVTRTFRNRGADGDEKQEDLFEVGEKAPPSDSEFKRRMVRNAFTEIGWERRVNELAESGATDDEVMKFIARELPAAEESTRYGEGILKVVGFESPAVTYLSDETENPRDRIRVAGRDLLRIFRAAFGVEVVAKRTKKSA